MARSTNRSSSGSASSSTSSRAQRALRRSSRGSSNGGGGDNPEHRRDPNGSQGLRNSNNNSNDNDNDNNNKLEALSLKYARAPLERIAAPHEQKQQQPPLLPPNNNSSNSNNNNNHRLILRVFYDMLQQGAPPHLHQNPGTSGAGAGAKGAITIDLLKAGNVLEAAAGNMALAANLYWDDYFATQASGGSADASASSNPNVSASANPNASASANPNASASANPNASASAAFAKKKKRNRAHHTRDVDQDEDGEQEDRKPSAADRGLPKIERPKIELPPLELDFLDLDLGPEPESQRSDRKNPPQNKRRLRRSLDQDFQAADDDEDTKIRKRVAKRARKSHPGDPDHDDDDDDDDNNNNNDDDNDNDDAHPQTEEASVQNRRHSKRGRRKGTDNDNDNSSSSNEDNYKDECHYRQPFERLVAKEVAALERRRVMEATENSISVSDDELLGWGGAFSTWARRRSASHRHRRGENRDPPGKSEGTGSSAANRSINRSEIVKAANAIHRKINPNNTHLCKPSAWFLSPEQNKNKSRRRQRGGNDEGSLVDSDSDEYISDDEWLCTDCEAVPVKPSLWGMPPMASTVGGHSSSSSQPQGGEANNDGSDGGNDQNGNNNNNNNNNEENQEGNGNVVVADDDAMNVSSGEEDRVPPDAKIAEPDMGVPHTWLNAGFQLSECGTGLCVPSPKPEDIPFFVWRRLQENDQRNSVPPPYHCKSLTAVTSLVTALLYSGAAIQGDQITCASGRPAWVSLTPEERKREFESRLADALSVLIFVAAKASQKRKQKAHRKAVSSSTTNNNNNNKNNNGGDKKNEEYSELLREAIAERKASLEFAGPGNESHHHNDAQSSNRSKTDGGKNDPDEKATSEDAPEKKRPLTPQERIQHMRRRLDLIPTTVWTNHTAVAASRSGDGPLYNKKVRVKSTWTNIRDIKLYVQSHMRVFTEKGGIALFLEAIVGIHGNNVIARQLKRCASASKPSASAASASASAVSPSMNKENEGDATIASASTYPECNEATATNDSASAPGAVSCSLIACTCEDRQTKLQEEKPLPLNVRIDPNNLLDMTPDGTECASAELLTLLLTGRVRSDWKDCSAGELGVGILTETSEDVSEAMARPKRPVWMLRGETCYSVLTIESYWNCGTATKAWSSGEDIKTISKVDKPGVPLGLLHWNGWYGQRGKTEMRLIASEPSSDIPAKKRLRNEPLGIQPRAKISTASLLMERRRHESLINAISAKEHESNRTKQQENPIRPFELERILILEEDQKLYPNNHKMWRFDVMGIGMSGEQQHQKQKQKQQPASDDWIPYYRLTQREKLLVETKLGPKIKSILWTRWPRAVIDHFVPEKGGHPVV